ncbi:MAG: HAMP domain-containing histidine kinase [Pelagibacteraceae bacterium]|nr:HAMP domain-containing histidine kinase [Pelagibacteraceae bacterium]
MALVTLGVNKSSKFALNNLPLSIQILSINFFITFIGFFFLILFNYFLIKNDDSIERKRIIANQNLNNIQNFLEKNSIIRVPLFNDNCTGEYVDTCKDDINFELSDPVLEPKITQEFILNNYFNSEFNIKIYNDDWIKLVDTLDLYDLSVVQEIDLKEKDLNINNLNIFDNFSQEYLRFFSNYYNYLIKRELQNLITKEKAEISYVKETIKNQVIKAYIIKDGEEYIYQYFTAPIINNDKIYGVIILNYPITNQASNLGFISLNILIFYILFVLIMVLLSLIFSQSLVSPIKKLSRLTILERERVNRNQIIYPERKDEIGVLSKEIQNMSQELKAQIIQLEKFSADVSHELKNPLTSLQSAMELIDKNNISPENKKLLIQNIQNDLKRMNQLITDISKFTRLKAEIELEKNEYINLNSFLDEIPIIFSNNTKDVELILEKHKENLEIVANKNKLIQVFINLIENSLSLSSKKSKILIRLSKIDNSKVAIKVYDQGRGVDSKDSEKIFERFYSDRQENIKNHSGLGLSIAREIITYMNGQLVLDKSDNSKYSGACFLIILPVKQST